MLSEVPEAQRGRHCRISLVQVSYVKYKIMSMLECSAHRTIDAYVKNFCCMSNLTYNTQDKETEASGRHCQGQ